MEEKNKPKELEKDSSKRETEKTPEKKETGKVLEKKERGQESIPKERAAVFGRSLRISPKNCFAICKLIKGKTLERAITLLENVIKKKQVVKMQNREVPHRKGRGISGGRYPKNASIELIKLLKQLKANASVNGIENPIITLAKADKASRPHRKEGRRAKRAHVYLEVKDINKLNTKEEN